MSALASSAVLSATHRPSRLFYRALALRASSCAQQAASAASRGVRACLLKTGINARTTSRGAAQRVGIAHRHRLRPSSYAAPQRSPGAAWRQRGMTHLDLRCLLTEAQLNIIVGASGAGWRRHRHCSAAENICLKLGRLGVRSARLFSFSQTAAAGRREKANHVDQRISINCAVRRAASPRERRVVARMNISAT